MSLVYFILLLGGLIFFHELGHFLVGKLLGVRVLKFAVGFGPSIPWLHFTKGETEYSINVFPLGGYVRFFGDDPTEDLPENERRGSFLWAPLWRRFLIVLAGPIFNLILPLLILFPTFLFQDETEPAVVGVVVKGGPAEQAGLRPGDEIVAIGDEPVGSWWEMEQLIAASPAQPLQVTLLRDGAQLDPVEVVPESVHRKIVPQLDMTQEVGRIQVIRTGIAAVIAVAPGSAGAAAGLRSWDRVVALDEREVTRWDQLERWLAAHPGPKAAVTIVRRDLTTKSAEGKGERLNFEVPLDPDAYGAVAGIRSAEMLVSEVELDGTLARQTGLLPGDLVLGVDGEEYRAWSFFVHRVRKAPDEPHELRYRRGPLHGWLRAVCGELLEAALPAESEPLAREVVRSFRLEKVVEKDEFNMERTVYPLGASNRPSYVDPELVPTPRRLSYAFRRTLKETWNVYQVTGLFIVGLFRGHLPVKDLGGPILIANLASKTSERGWGYFWTIMVWLSVNLGFLNLLPVPILDGGHLMFFTIEAIKRKPLSLRARQIATYFGLAFIVLLMVLVFKNDLERNWDDIMNFFGCQASW